MSTKEMLETESLALKAAVPVASAKPDANRMRADAVSLDLPVRVHGSRTIPPVGGAPAATEPFEEETSTMIVFPQGGVVRMGTPVSVGQMLVLTNQRSNQDAICRVVKVRAYSTTQSYVEVEFTHRHAGYWGVHFGSDDGEATSAAVPISTSTRSEAEKKPLVTPVASRLDAMPKVPAPPARKESAFAPIGSQEDVQPAAAQMEAKSFASPMAVAPPPPAPAVQAIRATNVPLVPEESIDEPMESGAMRAEIEAPRTQTFGALTGGMAATSDFGSRLGGSSAQVLAPGQRSEKGIWIAACAFFLVAGLAGGALYFRQHTPVATQQMAQEPANSTGPAAQSALAPVMPPPSSAPASQTDQTNASIADAMNSMPSVTERPLRPESKPPETQPPAATSPVRGAVSIAPRQAAMPKNFAATNVRPVARVVAERQGLAAAPTVSALPQTTAGLADVLSSSEAAPPPPPQAQPQTLTRVRVGGVIVQAKLVHAVPPKYPSAATRLGISGNVVILAQVDRTGSVASMKIVSGPAALQQAAMTALKQWKYQPATLDGVPIETNQTVTIRFQQQ